MSDEFGDPEDFEPQDSSVIRQLRAENKRLTQENTDFKSQAERTPDLETKLAFYEADLPRDLSDARRKAIIATAEELTADGYRKAAADLGFIEPPAPAVPPEELAAMERIANGANGATTVDPALFEAEIAAARNEQEWRAVMDKYGKVYG